MSRRERILFALVVVHLGFVVLGAASYSLEDLPYLAKPASIYADFSGASSGYGFFAPGVDSDIRAYFEIKTADGKVTRETLQRGKSHEADLRVSNIVGKFWSEVEEEDRRRAMTASWAGKMFSRFPKAKEIVVKVESFSLPSREEYLKNPVTSWEPMYSAKYVKR